MQAVGYLVLQDVHILSEQKVHLVTLQTSVVFTFVGIICHFFTKEMIESCMADRMGKHELRCIIYSLTGCG